MTVLRNVTSGVAILALAAITVWAARGPGHHARPVAPAKPLSTHLLAMPQSYLGVYAPEAPGSFAGASAFSSTTGVSPGVVAYYSGWYEQFSAAFANDAAAHGSVPLVQIEPTGISLAKIASGQFDSYLRTYARAVRAYRHPVILSFGHEMNGNWYSWGYRHSSPKAFVAAWRHIVTVFRTLGAGNVTWLWTVNIISHAQHEIPDPAPWWPGGKYVTWVGIDGYYLKATWKFAPLFGPTIAAVRALTRDPILISETAAAPAAGQPAKIADLFAGIRTYGLLGFIWFDKVHHQDFRLTSPAAITALRQGARAYQGQG